MIENKPSDRFACVLESAEQLRALQCRMTRFPQGVDIFCTCSETQTIMDDEGLEYFDLSESRIKDQWERINAWAKHVSLNWFQSSDWSEQLMIEGINVGNIVNRPVSHMLIHRLKIELLFDCFVKNVKRSSFILFQIPGENDSVNALLKKWCHDQHHAYETIDVKPRRIKANALREWARFMIGKFKMPRFSNDPSFDCLGMGAIKYILPLLSELAKESAVFFTDASYQLATEKICRQQRISYGIMSSFVSSELKKKIQMNMRRLIKTLEQKIELLNRDPVFCFEGKVLSGVGELLIESLKKDLYIKLLQMAAVREAVQKYHVKLLVLHEDIDLFRAAALEARRIKIPVLVISHGIPPTRSDWSQIAKGAGIADTLVQSEFEKDKYVKTGYSPDLIHVLGLPRFDKIYERRSQLSGRSNSGEKIVLYCPHMLTRITKPKKGYLGIHTPGGVTRINSIRVIEACRDLNYKLVIKPHANSKDIDLWKQLIERYGNEKTCLADHRSDIFVHLAAAELIIATFSTVVIEAMLFDKNVITINFTGEPDIHPYAELGIAWGVYQPEHLKEAIRKSLEDEKLASQLKSKRRQAFDYFGGQFDGQATKRGVLFAKKLINRDLVSVNEAEDKNLMVNSL